MAVNSLGLKSEWMCIWTANQEKTDIQGGLSVKKKNLFNGFVIRFRSP